MGQKASIIMRADENLGRTTALVAMAAHTSHRAAPAPSQRPNAAFLAHLIATARQAPQTRDRRRDEPGAAIAAYAQRTAALPESVPAAARSVKA